MADSAPNPNGDAPVPAPPAIFARVRLRTWIRETIEGVDRVSQIELTDRAFGWLKDQQDVLNQFLTEAIRPMVASEVQSVVAATRGTDREIMAIGNTVQSRDAQEQKGVLRPKFQHWLEYDGRANVNVLRMNRAQLIAAATYRSTQSRKERVLALLWTRLASKLVTDTAVVEDVFTADDIENEYRDVEQHLS